ncbi:TetR/AcrR family transcriptional regulator [Patulibacter sp.]|uniref:TetR/AcrR family transcriptional regulator n=1 Tax=Patulibacter sp. TaxID=1912859 RepID=UPI0027188260|nr:TetR/AcrR family transcriptional regulator [Patulibacter sp.]MDO9409820.1 helix-turn-helix domain-containing protein [Patulibacter sp.]
MTTDDPHKPKQERSLRTRAALLDAAVEELLARGYGALSTASVARRAGVSRGAQQHHFASKDELLIEAVSELAARRMTELREGIAADAPVAERIARTLDLALEQYAGPLYAATLELALAARSSDALRAAIADGERTVGPQIQAMGRELLGGTALDDATIDARWTTAVSTARGYASLILLGHPADRVRAQWRASRDDVVGLLLRR